MSRCSFISQDFPKLEFVRCENESATNDRFCPEHRMEFEAERQRMERSNEEEVQR